MAYEVDTSTAVSKPRVRKHWLHTERTDDGTVFTVTRRIYQPLKVSLYFIIGFALCMAYIKATTNSAHPLGGLGIFFGLLFILTTIVLGLGSFIAFIPALLIAAFSKRHDKFIVSPQGVVLLTGKGKLLKKLLPWEYVSDLSAKYASERIQTDTPTMAEPSSSHSGTHTEIVYGGPMGLASASVAAGAQGIAQGAGNVFTKTFEGVLGSVEMVYKDQGVDLATMISDSEAIILLNQLYEARQAA